MWWKIAKRRSQNHSYYNPHKNKLLRTNLTLTNKNNSKNKRKRKEKRKMSHLSRNNGSLLFLINCLRKFSRIYGKNKRNVSLRNCRMKLMGTRKRRSLERNSCILSSGIEQYLSALMNVWIIKGLLEFLENRIGGL